jgi:pimeloyl-ACP methyl ester carboxylesterase
MSVRCLDKYGVTASLLGHSYGGIVAQSYALRFPNSVRRLILADTFFSGEMWQANNESSSYELRNQFDPEFDPVYFPHRMERGDSALGSCCSGKPLAKRTL